MDHVVQNWAYNFPSAGRYFYDFYFCAEKSIQLNIKLEMKIIENLKTLKEEYIFILHKIDKRSWFQWFTDIILDRD
jgi:hypothetical protein